MQQFHKILFVSHSISDEINSLQQALSLARNNGASLDAILVCPELPRGLQSYKDKFETSLRENLQKSIQKSRDLVKVSESDVPIQINMLSGDMSGTGIIRQVLKGEYDLVVKEAEPMESGKGFKALDMELLRKCPCPLWIGRPLKHSHNAIRVAVAIDPDPYNLEQVGRDLSLKLLTLSRSLADTCDGDGVLDVISCWKYEYEGYLRGNIWVNVSEAELGKHVRSAQMQHRKALEELVAESGLAGNIRLHHIKGDPDEIIPQYIEDKQIDILVMGTVARTGIPELIMGNTAENILQKLPCSLMALKPNGFVSPVKAY